MASRTCIFFQAADGIRAPLVLEFRRVLFRSRVTRMYHGPSCRQAARSAPRSSGPSAGATTVMRSEERRVGKERGCRQVLAADQKDERQLLVLRLTHAVVDDSLGRALVCIGRV